ncbi:MAG: hypothetical protein IJS67_01070 [Clostridia bacterium]|nr:hypothetical protein [Clostridia bacterium]
MKRLVKRFLTLALAAAMGLTVVSCGGDEEWGESVKEVDEKKTQFYIGNYDGGLGHTWLEKIIANFEEDYKDYSFEEGKKGVQIYISNKKEEFSGDQLLANLPYGQESIVCTQSVDYSVLTANNVLYDVTDWVTENIYDDNGDMIYDADGKITKAGATKNIIGKLDAEYEAYFNIGGHYYGMPFSSLISGMYYDADLFDAKGLFMFADGEFGAKQADVDAQKADPAIGLVSVGPDGKAGTYDDGLPETWAQFKRLMNEMINQSIIPFTWDGAHDYQRAWFFSSLMAAYEGYDDYMLNYTLDGTDKTQSDLVITPSTGALLGGQNGRKAACKAVYDIVSNSKNYSSAAFAGAQTHVIAQREYVESTNTNRKIAMFIEGSYWLNEARDVCDEMEEIDEKWSYYNRNVKYLPVPRFVGEDGIPDQANNDTVLCGQLSTTGILVNAKLTNVELTKLFFQYMHSRKSLVICETDTITYRPLEYKFTEEEKQGLSVLGKSMREILEAGAKVTNTLPKSSVVKNNNSFFSRWIMTSSLATGQQNDVFRAYKNNSKLTWQEYADGIAAYTDKNYPIK